MRASSLVDLSVWRGGDPVRSPPFRGLEHLHVAGPRVETAINAVLPGEPMDAVLVESSCIQVRVPGVLRQLPDLDLLGFRIEPHNRVLATVGDPCRAVRALNHTVRR